MTIIVAMRRTSTYWLLPCNHWRKLAFWVHDKLEDTANSDPKKPAENLGENNHIRELALRS
jgi:hypothetical protein